MVVSSCLAGVNSRFDGSSSPCQRVIDLVREGQAIPVCPEQLGGLPTPRPAAERRGELVLTQDGQDLTDNFRRGAQEALRIAQLAGCREAILKSDSPSCGSGRIRDGTFSGRFVDRDGVFAELLKQHGITVLTEHDVCGPS